MTEHVTVVVLHIYRISFKGKSLIISKTINDFENILCALF